MLDSTDFYYVDKQFWVKWGWFFFLNKSLVLTKAAFIWLKSSKNSNIVKY